MSLSIFFCIMIVYWLFQTRIKDNEQFQKSDKIFHRVQISPDTRGNTVNFVKKEVTFGWLTCFPSSMAFTSKGHPYVPGYFPFRYYRPPVNVSSNRERNKQKSYYNVSCASNEPEISSITALLFISIEDCFPACSPTSESGNESPQYCGRLTIITHCVHKMLCLANRENSEVPRNKGMVILK